jgi:hypothetical protein
MKDVIHGKTSELVFDLDEVGPDDWEDREPKRAIVSISIHEEDVHHPISRKFAHLSLLACVSAACDSRTLFVMSAAPIPHLFWLHALPPDEDAPFVTVRPIYG